MTLFDGSNTWAFKKYDNNGVWKWNGDWNDKNSPYYAVYNGQYNPVKGKWKLIISGGFTVAYEQYCWFKDNLSLYKGSKLNGSDYRLHTKYEINDIGILGLDDSLIKNYATNKYWIEGDTLYLQGVSTSGKLQEISKLVKVK